MCYVHNVHMPVRLHYVQKDKCGRKFQTQHKYLPSFWQDGSVAFQSPPSMHVLMLFPTML